MSISARPKRRSGASAQGELLPGLTRRAESSRTVWNAVAFQQSLAKQLSLPGEIRASHQQTRRTVQGAKKMKPSAGYNSQQKKSIAQPLEEERVLGQQRDPLSLAQRLGLCDAPPEPLSEADWDKVKIQSGVRGDSCQPCAICHDTFDHLRQQVLLSCSHTFHRVCLEAFERFSSSKCCPMCRRQDYEKRLIFDGARSFRSCAVTRIQALWRGYCVRCWYKALLRRMAAPDDPMLRKRHFQRRLTDIADSWIAESDKQSQNVEDLLEDVDEALLASREVTASATTFLESQTQSSTVKGELAWERAAMAAKDRKERDCPICMTSLMRSRAVLLSCSHVFHKQCVMTMESFGCGRLPCCPVCRAAYVRRDWLTT